MGMPAFLPTSTASRVSTNAGTPPFWNVSTVCTTSFLPRVVGVAIHLQCGSDKRVHGILTGELAKNAIGAQAAITAGKENVGPSANIAVHADLTAKTMDALHPSALDRRNQRRMWVQQPMFAD